MFGKSKILTRLRDLEIEVAEMKKTIKCQKGYHLWVLGYSGNSIGKRCSHCNDFVRLADEKNQ